ncbi:MAG: heavy metal translocating P-type ATPase metal-binding domain-containing protein [Methylococcaceae bacterium]|nr:heavy metal translocating P-type ATPase metal-binding domain-containing protein [Methylococcaceae bacterium]
MSDENKNCDLCQLPIEAPGFVLITTSGLKQFCCEGCQGIYRMLHEDELVGDGTAPAASY